MDEVTDYDFFIAHASADITQAEYLFDLLAGSARVFLDTRCLLPGDDWPAVIQGAQRSSRVTVVLVSDRTEQAFYETEEIAAAISLAREKRGGHRVVPVYLSGQRPQQIPYGLRQKHWLAVTGSTPVEQVAARLLDLCRAPAAELDGSRAAEGGAAIPGAASQQRASPAAARALPDDGQRCLDEAERIALTITDPFYRAEALTGIAEAGSAAHPGHAGGLLDEASRAARAITDPAQRVIALARIAGVVAAANPQQATQLLDEAGDALSIAAWPQLWDFGNAWHCLAVQLAPFDPERAEQIARSIPPEYARAWALEAVAKVLAFDAGRATRVACSITDETFQASALWAIAATAATYDPERAEYAARAVACPDEKVHLLVELAETFVSDDPDRRHRLLDDAEQLARTLSDPKYPQGPHPLCHVASAARASDPARARRLLDEAERIVRDIADPYRKAEGLVGIARVAGDITRVRRLLGDAERITRTYTGENAGLLLPVTLVGIAECVAAYDPGDAERIAGTISGNDNWRTRALVRIATVAIAAGDTDRADRLLDDAENLARTSRGPNSANVPDFASAVATYDPGRAERLAAMIADPVQRDYKLAEIGQKMSTAHPRRAEQIARRISEPRLQVRLLTEIARAHTGAPD